MKRIQLNYFNRAAKMGVSMLALSLLLFYWSFTGNAAFHLFGLDPASSSFRLIMFIIAVINLLPGIDVLVKWVSVLRYGDFCIILDNISIRYPSTKGRLMKFTQVVLSKASLSYAEYHKEGQYTTHIVLKDKLNAVVGTIPGQLTALQIYSPEELTAIINEWITKKIMP